MSFFNDFKTDLSQAVNELATGTLGHEDAAEQNITDEDIIPDPIPQQAVVPEPPKPAMQPIAPPAQQKQSSPAPINTVADTPMFQTAETAVIASGVLVKGDIKAECPVLVKGKMTGNIKTTDALTITGSVRGNSSAESIRTDGAQIKGELQAKETADIGKGSVVQGNIRAGSATIAGAVQGDIDVNGQVILAATAVVVGSIKAKTLQIASGAVMEGPCSLCYADKKPSDIFGVDDTPAPAQKGKEEHNAKAENKKNNDGRPEVKTNYGERAWN